MSFWVDGETHENGTNPCGTMMDVYVNERLTMKLVCIHTLTEHGFAPLYGRYHLICRDVEQIYICEFGNVPA